MDVGLDRLPSEPALVARLRTARVGLLAHPASVNRSLTHAALVLKNLGISPKIFFGPEHGYGGEAQDMVGVTGATDGATGAPIVSLYGETFEELLPRAEHLSLIDILVVDLADVGSRYYTFVWTVLLVVRAAAKAGVHVLLLDRPNPIGSNLASAEGSSQKQGFLSFVGLMPVAVRHALTLAELVAHFASKEGISLGKKGVLEVLGVQGLARESLANGWDRPFVLPSPNMPTAETALVYPGGCLLEGTNLSEGRGTTRPFEIVGAPWLDGARLAADLQGSGLAGFVARPLTFRATFQKHAGKISGGVQIHVTDPVAFRPYATYLALLGFAQRQDREAFRWRTERYEYVDDIPAIDLLTGSDELRVGLDGGADPVEVARALAAVDPAYPELWSDAVVACGKALE